MIGNKNAAVSPPTRLREAITSLPSGGGMTFSLGWWEWAALYSEASIPSKKTSGRGVKIKPATATDSI
jgi:hypothetical protein